MREREKERKRIGRKEKEESQRNQVCLLWVKRIRCKEREREREKRQKKKMLASGIADRLVSSTMCSSASSADGKRARSQQARAMTGTGRSDGGETASSARTGRRKRRGSVSASAAYLSCRRHHLHRHNQSRSPLEQSGIVTKTAQRRRKGGNIRSLAPNALFDPLKFDPNRVSVSFCENSVLNDSPTSLLKREDTP